MGQLIDGVIRAVPYRQFDSNKIVLRAEFGLKYAKFFPGDLLTALQGREVNQPEAIESAMLQANLCDELDVPRYVLEAARLSESMTLAKVGNELGISKRQAHLPQTLFRNLD